MRSSICADIEVWAFVAVKVSMPEVGISNEEKEDEEDCSS